MVKTAAIIYEELDGYANKKTKLARLVEEGRYFPIVKGLYETERCVSPHLLSASICSPSYVSFDYALSFYGLIPEAAYTVTAATWKKNRTKLFQTPFGGFWYHDVPPKAFPWEIALKSEGEYWYRIAEPEKALCDKVYLVSPVHSQKEMYALLTEDMRMEDEDLVNLQRENIGQLSEFYGSTNVRLLAAVLRRLK